VPTRREGGGGGAGTNYWGPKVRKRARTPNILQRLFLSFSNPLRPSPSHSVADSLSNLVQEFLASPLLLRPELAVRDPEFMSHI
jgi:hypothetical protein